MNADKKLCIECPFGQPTGITHSDTWYCNNPKNFRDFVLLRDGATMLQAVNWCPHADRFKSAESYQCCAVSSAHLTPEDVQTLTIAAGKRGMIMERSTGFFIKLYEEPETIDDYGLMAGATALLHAAHEAGYRMVEFDCDAPLVDDFPIYDW